MSDRELRWVNSGTLSSATVTGKPVQYQMDWCKICIEMMNYEIVSSYKFFDAPNLTGFSPAGEIWKGLSAEGRTDYRDQLIARVKPEEEPRLIRIRGTGTLLGTLINVLKLPYDGTANRDDARVCETVELEIRAEGKPVTGQLRVGEKGLRCMMWVEETRMDEIVAAIVSRRAQPMLQIELAAMLFREDGLWEGFITGRPKPLILIDEDEYTPAVLSSVNFLDETEGEVLLKQPDIIPAQTKARMANHAIWLLPIAVAGFLFIFGR